MISHDASLGMIHGWSANVSWGVGVKNLTARNSPDMLGDKIGMKQVPVRALNAPYSSKCIVFQGEAIRDDGKSPNPLCWVETADFRADIFAIFFVDFWAAPNKREPPMCSCV